MENKQNGEDLNKKLEQSKKNIDINDINNIKNKEKDFLVSKVWDCLDDNQIGDLEDKVESIYNELNKENLKKLITDINKCNFENFYHNYNHTQNMYRIGAVCNLDSLVESTYCTQEINEEIKSFDLNKLSPLIYKFRNILGDGNCFYRGLIFSILENIILTNNIMQMKELLILYHEKINKNNKLIKEKEYLKIIEQMNISIVSEIIYILIRQMENNLRKAYIGLLKVFLFCNDFDFGIIFFTRYLIYEYISANEDKLYSKNYQVEVGCLLPDDYQIDKGDKNEYYFENFYSLELMSPNTFAEKIILYIAPYVFNINMIVLMYDFGINGEKSVIQEKEFFNENKSNLQMQVNLLFRKSHYDIYYKLNFYEDYKENLNILINKNEDINNFEKERKDDNNNIENSQKENKEFVKENNNSNNNFMNDKNIYNNIDNNQNNISDEENTKENFNNYFKDDENKTNKNKNIYNQLDNQNNQPICLECNKPYLKEDYIFGLCENCLSNQLKSFLLIAYLEFVKVKTNLVNSLEKFRDFLKQKRYRISIQENISLYEAIYNSNLSYNDLFVSVRSQLCLCCGKTINFDEYFLELPCKCRICSIKCFNTYLRIISKHVFPDSQNSYINYINLLSCFCGFIYNTPDVLNMIKEMDKYQMIENKKFYQRYILYFWNWRCCMCKKNFAIHGYFGKIFFDCPEIDRTLLYPTMELKHLLCGDCFREYNINKQRNFYCNICLLEHEPKKFFTVNYNNEENQELDF